MTLGSFITLLLPLIALIDLGWKSGFVLAILLSMWVHPYRSEIFNYNWYRLTLMLKFDRRPNDKLFTRTCLRLFAGVAPPLGSGPAEISRFDFPWPSSCGWLPLAFILLAKSRPIVYVFTSASFSICSMGASRFALFISMIACHYYRHIHHHLHSLALLAVADEHPANALVSPNRVQHLGRLA